MKFLVEKCLAQPLAHSKWVGPLPDCWLIHFCSEHFTQLLPASQVTTVAYLGHHLHVQDMIPCVPSTPWYALGRQASGQK